MNDDGDVYFARVCLHMLPFIFPPQFIAVHHSLLMPSASDGCPFLELRTSDFPRASAILTPILLFFYLSA